MPKLDIPPEGPELTWHTMRDWLYKLWLNVKGLTFGADSSTYSSAILATAGQSDSGTQKLLGTSAVLFAGEGQTSQSIPNAVYTTLTNWTVQVDSVGGMNATTGVYTVRVPGVYIVTGTCSFSAAGWWTIPTAVGSSVAINGTQKTTPFLRTVNVSGSSSTGAQTPQTVWIGMLNSGDTIALQVFQNSGATQTTEGGHTSFFAAKIGDILQQ